MSVRCLRQKGLDLGAPMDGGVIPDDQETIPYLSYQVHQKRDGVQPVQGLLANQRIDLPFERQGTHDRQMVVCLPFLQDRRVSSWSIGLYHARQQVKARFIHKNEMQTETTGFLHKSRPSRKSPALNGGFIALD